jgi:hypothetical protein
MITQRNAAQCHRPGAARSSRLRRLVNREGMHYTILAPQQRLPHIWGTIAPRGPGGHRRSYLPVPRRRSGSRTAAADDLVTRRP